MFFKVEEPPTGAIAHIYQPPHTAKPNMLRLDV
jgi:hypothetical protein